MKNANVYFRVTKLNSYQLSDDSRDTNHLERNPKPHLQLIFWHVITAYISFRISRSQSLNRIADVKTFCKVHGKTSVIESFFRKVKILRSALYESEIRLQLP